MNLGTSLNFKLFQQCNNLFSLPFGTFDLGFLKIFGLNICKCFLPNLLAAYGTCSNGVSEESISIYKKNRCQWNGRSIDLEPGPQKYGRLKLQGL